MRYYFGIGYPDGRLFNIVKKNQLEPLNLQALIPWSSTQKVLIDKPIDETMPNGEYKLYILRLAETITDIDKGEWNVSTFKII
jgi:hypothetical protein